MSSNPAIHWSPAAEALFRLDRPTAVSAGAGSGKTTALVELCLRLLSGEATGRAHEPSELVAITFTEKAAEELCLRLRQALAERARTAEPAKATEWLSRLRGLDRMAVGTIHGFATRLLREHAPEADVDPEFTVLDEEAATALRQEAALGAILAAADSGHSVVLELCAGHGVGQGASGPRRGLSAVVAELVRERATLGRSGPLEPHPADPEALDQTRCRLIEAAFNLATAQPGPTTETGREAQAALAGALERLAPEDRTGPIGSNTVARLQSLAEEVRPWRKGKADAPELTGWRVELGAAAKEILHLYAEERGEAQRSALCALVAEAEARYGRAKDARSALDFDDLLARARDLLVHNPTLLQELRRRVRALLVDEYQDVNRLQQELFELLATGDEAPLLVAVGDLKQSIYRFRGADVAVFSGVMERFRSGEAGRVLHLSVNHRSTPAAIELVNAVFERCMQPAGAPRPYEIRFTEDDRLVPMRQGGLAPACELLEDGIKGNAAARRAREARAIASRIQALVSGAAGVALVQRGADSSTPPRTPRYGDIALLFRRLTQIGVYERALREAGIPYRLARGGGFYQASEIRDLGEFLASLFEPDDAVAWAALLRSPWCAVSEGTLFLLSRLGLGSLWRRESSELVAEVQGMWPAGAGQEETAPELARLERLLREWRGLHELRDRLPVDELLQRAVERLDLESALLAGPDGERRAVNLRKALGLARRFAEAGGSAAAFGERLRRMALQPPREPEAEVEAEGGVAILSVHQAKGLEWPIVLVPDLAARLPNDTRRALLDGRGRLCAKWFDLTREDFFETTSAYAARQEGGRAAAAESRRLFYVALTRARDYLVLSGAEVTNKEPSTSKRSSKGNEESWSAFLSRAVEDRPELVRRVAAADPGEPLSVPSNKSLLDEEELPRISTPILSPSVPLAAVRLAVTDVVEYARCPRRHWLSRTLGFPEQLPDSAGSSQDDPARATARGTLAHAMLSEIDLGALPLERRGQLIASATRRGLDPDSSGIRRILGDVARFLDSPAGRRLTALCRSGVLHRELPFLMKLGGENGPACYLTGAIDALVEERRELAVIDFKYALPRPGAAERYRWQLLTYALAASRAFPGRPVRVSLQFLRGSCKTIELTPTPEELQQLEERVPSLALGAFRGEGERSTPAELGRDEVMCRGENCGYVFRCYPG